MAEPSNNFFSKSTRELFFYTIFALGLIIVFWNIFDYILSPLVMKAKLFQVSLLYKIYSGIYELLIGPLTPDFIRQDGGFFGLSQWFGKMTYGLGAGIQKYQSAMESGYVPTFWEVLKGFYYFGSYLSPYYCLFFGYMMYRYHLQSEDKYFKKVHSMKTLIEQERELYPEIYPVSTLELINSSDTTGSLASPLTEKEFVVRHNLYMDSKDKNSIYRDAFGKDFRRLDKTKAKKILDNQLKERFQGFEKMSRHRQAIFVLLGVGLLDNTKSIEYKNHYTLPKARELAKMFADNGNKYTDEMAGSWVEEYYNLFKDNPLFNEYVLKRHAYELTMFMTMLQGFYRQQGVLNPTSLFWWLRLHDKELFLALNYVGRQNSTFVEISGIVSHWIVETRLKVPLIGKRTEAAVEALERGLYSFTDDGIEEAIFTPS